MKRKWPRILWKIGRWLLGLPLALLFLLWLILHTGPGQRWVTQRAENYLRQTLQTDLGIGGFSFLFPRAISLHDVYVNTPAGEKLLRWGTLGVNLDMWDLLNQQVTIKGITLSAATVHLVTTDSSSNWAFIPEAFTASARDTTVAVQPVQDQPASPWKIHLNGAKVNLSDIDLYYQDDPAGLLLDLDLSEGRIATDTIDLEQQIYLLRSLAVDRLQGQIVVNTVEPVAEPDAPMAELLAGCEDVSLQRIGLDFQLDSTQIHTNLPELTATGLRYAATPATQHITLTELVLTDTDFTYDTALPHQATGFDPNHINLQQAHAALHDFVLQNDSISVTVEELTFREQSGLELQTLRGTLAYQPNQITLEELFLQTPHTEISAPRALTRYQLSGAGALEQLFADLDVQGEVGTEDVLLLLPDLGKHPLLARHPQASLEFYTKLRGDEQGLAIDQLTLRAPGTIVRTQGTLSRWLDTDRMEGRLDLQELSVQMRDILPLLPEDLLPSYTDWPDRVMGQGMISYRDSRLSLDFRAAEERRSVQRLSRLALRGQVNQPLVFPNSSLDMQVDSAVLTRQTLQAYLPPNILPAGYSWPAYAVLKGQVSGPLDELELDLELALPEEEAFADLKGRVTDVMAPDSMYLDLNLQTVALNARGLQSLVPDSLLPASFKLPDLRIVEGRLEGQLDDLNFRIPIESSNGQWLIEGRYATQGMDVAVSIENLVVADLTRGPLRDSILRLDLQPVAVEATIAGVFQPAMDARITANITEAERGRLLILTAGLTDSAYTAEWTFDHPALAGTGNGRYAVRDSLASFAAEMDLQRADLAYFGLSTKPLEASGRVRAASTGLRLDRMDAVVRLDDIYLRGQEAVSFVDSLRMTAQFQDGENAVIVQSDVLEAQLTGNFEPVAVTKEFMRFLEGYWSEDVEQPDPVVHGNRVEFNLQVHNPRPLISGLIPGLERLSPLQLEFIYRDKEPELLINASLAELMYQGLELENTRIQATGDVNRLDLSAQWADIRYGEAVQMGRTVFTATGDVSSAAARRGGLKVDLNIGPEEQPEHHLGLRLRQQPEGLQIVMDERQTINTRSWTLPPGNEIILGDSSLIANNWIMRQGDRSIALSDENGRDLAVSFRDFNLRALSQIINSEQEIVAGRLNGTIDLQDVLNTPGIQADVRVDELTILEAPMGDLDAVVRQQEGQSFDLDIALAGAGNDFRLSGIYAADADLNLQLAVDQLQLASLEPFSLGYLRQAEGLLTGNLQLRGRQSSPRIDGQLAFQEAAFAVSLLGSRYRLDDQRLQFQGQSISFDNFTLRDSLGHEAVANGSVEVRSLTDIGLDLNLRARDFLAINSTAADNDLYYGHLLVDADVAITGDIQQPRVVVTATPKGNSNLTYQYVAANSARLETTQGVVNFTETYEWETILETGERDTIVQERAGMYVRTNLSINDNLLLRVIIDPLTQQEFAGRGEGNFTFIQYPNGRQELTGQVVMTSGTYDMVLEGLQPYRFQLREGSTVRFSGDPANPELDLEIENQVRTSPLPLVKTVTPEADLTGLRPPQTFAVVLDLEGDLEAMSIAADIEYASDAANNREISAVNNALQTLRQDQSRMYTTAITLITFKNFVIPLTDAGSSPSDNIVNGVAGAVSDALTNLVNQRLGFVEVDFGVESYQTDSGEENYNFRLSLQKSFFNDRLVISVDGVTNTADDPNNGEGQTYLDNVSVEYLLDARGNLRIKLFNDRDEQVFVGNNLWRFGGRLVFSKDFDRFIWEKG